MDRDQDHRAKARMRVLRDDEVEVYTQAGQGVAAAVRQAEARLTELSVAAARARERFQRFMLSISRGYEAHLLARRRAALGGNGSDGLSDLWQSAVCSAWLHESCPDDGTLRCSCRCHR